MKCPNCRNFVTAQAFLTGWHLFTFFTVAPFLCTPLVILDFCFILVTSNTVIWASFFGTHKFKLEVQVFIFHVVVFFRETFKLWDGNSCFAFFKKFLGFIFFLILFLCSTQLFKNQLKHTQDVYILFVFFDFQAACNCSN